MAYFGSFDDDPERQLITSRMSKSSTPKKSNYGSLRKEAPQLNSLLVNYKHKLAPGETLQGISLKYGVPIEAIKRANRLWSNDLALIKDILVVPMEVDKLQALNLKEEIIDESSTTPVSRKSSDSNNNDNETDNKAYQSYLDKFDSFITESKMKLKSLESNQNLNGELVIKVNNEYNYSEDDGEDLFKIRKKQQTNNDTVSERFDSRQHPHQNSNRKSNTVSTASSNSSLSTANEASFAHSSSSATNLSTMPEVTTKRAKNGGSSSKYLSSNGISSSSRARIAHESLQRLEREKDDLFEL